MAPPRGEVDTSSATATTKTTSSNKSRVDKDGNAATASTTAMEQETTIGPDLNGSKPPLDTKLYRQIMLPNGLWCLLIQDTVAMHQHDGQPMGFSSDDEDDEEEDEDAEMDEEAKTTSKKSSRGRGKKQKGDSDDENDDEGNDDEGGDDDDDGDSEDEEYDGGGIRDAAAALLVGAGSAYDPIECQGMAHFLEHLLFMGSEKYPGENEFGSFVSKHGGCDNAWTDLEYTVYHLSIPQEYLWPALDRLVQHFVAPLLLESAVDRELQAIESEFQLNRPSDECRRSQLICATSEADHYYSKFGWGNLRSLRDIPKKAHGVDPLKELRTFFNRYYYAANMRLVVMGANTLDQLQKQVQDIFCQIQALPRVDPKQQQQEECATTAPELPLPVDPQEITSWKANENYNSPLAKMGSPFTQKTSLQKIFRIVPLKQRHKLVLTWPIPAQIDKWKGKPCEFVSHLLGHEGAGSLLSYFRKCNWATGCSAGVGDDEQASSHWFFTFSVTLSKEGLKEWKQVVSAVYAYIGMLRMYSLGSTSTSSSATTESGGWPVWLYDELKQIDQVSYLYSDEESPEDVVCGLVENMAPHYKIPPARVLDGFALLFEFDVNGIHDLLEKYLPPTNARIDLTSSDFGKYAEMDLSLDPDSTDTRVHNLIIHEEEEVFDPKAWKPQIEPNFETFFWCSEVPAKLLEEWDKLAQPQKPLLPFSLPQENPFVPSKYDLKELPPGDSHHPLLNSTIKVCTMVGKTKQWFPATVVQYDSTKNEIRLSYEDEEDQWHGVDMALVDMKPDMLTPDFEGTLDKKKKKYRILSLALPGAGIARKFGDESDFDAEEGKSFPPVPPILPLSRLPKEISTSNALRMWYLQDRNFHRPITELRLQVICADANKTPLHKACADLLIELLHDTTLETSYLASVCDLASHLETTCIGFAFRFHGFDDKLLALFEGVFKVFVGFRGCEKELPTFIKPGRFEACLEILKRKYTNRGMTASGLSHSLRLKAIRKNYWSSSQQLKSLTDLTVETFAKTASSILESFAVESLIHGNVGMEDAKRAKELILSLIGDKGLKRQKYPMQSIMKVPAVKKHHYITVPSKDPTENNTGVEVYIQVGKDNLKERVLVDLLVHMMDDPIFNQIRTKDQFGYDVECAVRWTFGIMGVLFRVVSNVKSAQEIVSRIDKFLLDFRKDTLEKMSDSDFMEHLVALSTQKLDMFNSMPEETDVYWDEIVNGRFSWQVWRDEALILRQFTKAEVIAAFDEWLNPENERNILAVQVIGGGNPEVSIGRPDVEPSSFGDYADQQVDKFHQLCKNQLWGRINSKLF